MVSKRLIWIGATVGSIIGGYLPALWGDGSLLSPASLLLGGLGGILGIIAAYQLGRRFS